MAYCWMIDNVQGYNYITADLIIENVIDNEDDIVVACRVTEVCGTRRVSLIIILPLNSLTSMKWSKRFMIFFVTGVIYLK